MNIQHKELAGGRWNKLTLTEQMANVGSELERVFSWKKKQNEEYAKKAFERMLELLTLTKNSCSKISTLKEISRVYELLVDYFKEENKFASSEKLWRNYFKNFTYLAAKKRSV